MTETAVYAAGGVLWRIVDEKLLVLLIHRTQYRDVTLPKGKVDPGETRADAAVRELAEETGFAGADIEGFYDLDLVNQFHEPSVDGIMTAAVFAVRLHPDAEPRLSSEHDGAEWHALEEAHEQVIWPGYRTAIERIRDDLSDPDRAAWFELTLDGLRVEAGARPTGVAGW